MHRKGGDRKKRRHATARPEGGETAARTGQAGTCKGKEENKEEWGPWLPGLHKALEPNVYSYIYPARVTVNQSKLKFRGHRTSTSTSTSSKSHPVKRLIGSGVPAILELPE